MKTKKFVGGFTIIVIVVAVWILGTSFKKKDKEKQNISTVRSDTVLISQHLKSITKTGRYRNYRDTAQLNATAQYIYNCMKQYSDTVFFQTYKIGEKTYKNVIAKIGSSNTKPLVVVGAHYDVCGEQEGADDNASGVVGLLEIARMLQGYNLPYPIELVAYTLEEPPFFGTCKMGSYIHAQALKADNIPVYGMVCLEMIGYFNSEKGSQSYPIGALKLIYGTTGDYIVLAKRLHKGKFTRHFGKAFEKYATIPTRNFRAPSVVTGVDFSDHRNYWAFDYDALMITNTAFYRNQHYHQTSDRMETLDLTRMSKVIDATCMALIKLK